MCISQLDLITVLVHAIYSSTSTAVEFDGVARKRVERSATHLIASQQDCGVAEPVISGSLGAALVQNCKASH